MRRTVVMLFCSLLLIMTTAGCSGAKDDWFQTNNPAPPYNLLKLFDGYPSLDEAIDGLNTQRLNNGLARMMEQGTDVPEFLRIAAELVEAPFLVPTINELRELLGILQNEGPAHYDYPGVDHGGFYEAERGLLTMAERTDGFYDALDTVINNTELSGDVLGIAEQVVNYLMTEKTPAEIEDTMASMTGVKVYQHCMYGTSGYAVVLRAGNYTTSQLSTLGIVDDDISSLEVPIGMKITLYDADNFTGNSITIDGSDRCLTDNALLAGNWNDQASSVKVEYDISKLAQLLGKVTMSCDYPMWVNGSNQFAVNRDNANSGSYTTNTDLGNAVKGVIGLIYGLNTIAAADPEMRDTIDAMLQTDLPALLSALDTATMETTIQNMANYFAADEITNNTYDTDTSYNQSNPANGYIDASFKEAIRDMFPTMVKLFIRDDDSATTDDSYRIYEDATNHTSPVEGLCLALDKLKNAGIDYSQDGSEIEPSLKKMVEYNAYGLVRTNPNYKISFLDHMIFTIGGGYNFGYLTRTSSAGEPQWGGNNANFNYGHGTPTRGVITINDSMYSMTSNQLSILGLITMGAYDLALAHRDEQGDHIWRRSSTFTYNDGNKSNYRFYLGYDYPTMLLLPTAAAGDAGIPNGGRTVTTGYAATTSGNNYKTYWPKVEDGTGTLNTGAFLFSWISRACWDGQGPYYSTDTMGNPSTTTFTMPVNGSQTVNIFYKPNGEVYAYVYTGSDPWEYYYPSSNTTGIGNDLEDPDDTVSPKQRANRFRDILKSDYYMIERGNEGNFCVPPMQPNGSSYASSNAAGSHLRHHLAAGDFNASFFQLYERVQEWTNADIDVDADEKILGNASRVCPTQEEAMYRNYQWLMLEKKFMFTIPMWIMYPGLLGMCGPIDSAAFIVIEANGVVGLSNGRKGTHNGYWVSKNSEGEGTNPAGHRNNPDYGDSLLPGDARVIVFAREASSTFIIEILTITPEMLFEGATSGTIPTFYGPVLGSGFVLPEAVGKNIAPVARLGFVDSPDLVPSNFDRTSATYANRNRLMPIFATLAGTLCEGTKYEKAGSGYDYNYAGAHKYPLADLLEGLMIPLARPMYRYFNTNNWGWVPRIEYETPGNFSFFMPSVKNGSMDHRPKDELRTTLSIMSGLSDNTNDGILPKITGSSGKLVTRLLALLQKLGDSSNQAPREKIALGLEQVMTAMRIDKSKTINNGYTWLSHPAWMFARNTQADPVVTRDVDLYLEDFLSYEGPYRAADDWSTFEDFYGLVQSLVGGSRDITPNLVNIVNAVLAQSLTEDQIHGLLYTAGKMFARHNQTYPGGTWNYHGDTTDNDAIKQILMVLPQMHDILADGGSGARYGLMMENMNQLLSDHDSLLYYMIENMTTSYGAEQIITDLHDFVDWDIVSDPNSPLWDDLVTMLEAMADMKEHPIDLTILLDQYGFQRN